MVVSLLLLLLDDVSLLLLLLAVMVAVVPLLLGQAVSRGSESDGGAGEERDQCAKACHGVEPPRGKGRL